MPWYKTATVSTNRGSDPMTGKLEGLSSRVKARLSDKTGTISVTFRGSIDGTNYGGALTNRAGSAVIMSADGFTDLEAWPYYKIVNTATGSGFANINFYEWIEDPDDEVT
jgi:hypothetical protein